MVSRLYMSAVEKLPNTWNRHGAGLPVTSRFTRLYTI